MRMEVHPAILSYLRPGPRISPGGDYGGWSGFCDPRGWEDLSRFLTVYRKSWELPGDREVVSPSISPREDRQGFLPVIWSFYYKYQAHYQIDEALSGHRERSPSGAGGQSPFDEKLSVISLVP